MNQSASIASLLSPQQLMQARLQPMQGLPALPVPQGLQTWPAQPAALQVPRTDFGRVSALLTPDQVQTYTPRQNGALANPLSLFGASPVAAAKPALGMSELRHSSGLERLKQMSPGDLKQLGERDKQAFFAALLPAAVESEKRYGVPAEVTLAQAALESGWARSPIGGYNIFGIKGSGPAGKTSVNTKEYLDGRWVSIKDGFAKYHNFAQAVEKHGALFHNGYYDKAVNQYARDKNVNRFIDNIHGIYATDPGYSRKIKGIIDDFGLKGMVDATRMV